MLLLLFILNNRNPLNKIYEDLYYFNSLFIPCKTPFFLLFIYSSHHYHIYNISNIVLRRMYLLYVTLSVALGIEIFNMQLNTVSSSSPLTFRLSSPLTVRVLISIRPHFNSLHYFTPIECVRLLFIS